MAVGKAVKRTEDIRLLKGRGKYIEDIMPSGMLYVGLVRTPYAHARIRSIDRDSARRVPGVVCIVVADDHAEFSTILPGTLDADAPKTPYCDFKADPPHFTLPRTTVHYQGQAVAAVVAESPYAAADAVAAVTVDYEMLPVVASIDDALRPDAHRVHEDCGNIAAHFKVDIGDVASAFASAEVVFEARLVNQRLTSLPIETRGVLASWDPGRGELELWTTNQAPYRLRDIVARAVGLSYDRVRVRCGDVGGGFGGKGGVGPEDIVVSVLARHLGRPVRWMETRVDYFLGAHARDQFHDVRVAARRDGTILGMDIRLYKDVGAYSKYEAVVPTNTANHIPGQYRIPNLRINGWCVFTHKVPVRTTRGAGRAEAAFVMDRVLDGVARETGVDPLEVRRRNMVPTEVMPFRNGLTYRDGVAIEYDGGDYPLMLERAAELAEYTSWRKRQADLRDEGRFVGIGISTYVEATGIGPSEGCAIHIDDQGRVTVRIGVSSQGQGHTTSFAQICAEYLGARFEDIEVRGGDTSLLPVGFGTGASRVCVTTGNAVSLAASEVRRKMLRLAASVFECDERDLHVEDGRVSVLGSPDRSVTFARLARTARGSKVMAELGGPELGATAFYYPSTVTWSSGTHIAVVEVDPDTGKVDVLKYVVVHDNGVSVNPMIVEGQIHGGFAHGFGAALGEEICYDENAQLLTRTLMEYAIPLASDIPPFDLEHLTFPTDRNPLGVRGVGESTVISPPAAIAGAVEDALRGAVHVTRVPLTRFRVFELGAQARRAVGGP
jgi:carbon-monoxide dehydrogenase large subunit